VVVDAIGGGPGVCVSTYQGNNRCDLALHGYLIDQQKATMLPL
jgi:hypothetical protein